MINLDVSTINWAILRRKLAEIFQVSDTSAGDFNLDSNQLGGGYAGIRCIIFSFSRLEILLASEVGEVQRWLSALLISTLTIWYVRLNLRDGKIIDDELLSDLF